jgi:hypothetical protein
MKNYENQQTQTNKHKQMKRNLDNHTDTLITSEKLEKNIKINEKW